MDFSTRKSIISTLNKIKKIVAIENSTSIQNGNQKTYIIWAGLSEKVHCGYLKINVSSFSFHHSIICSRKLLISWLKLWGRKAILSLKNPSSLYQEASSSLIVWLSRVTLYRFNNHKYCLEGQWCLIWCTWAELKSLWQLVYTHPTVKGIIQALWLLSMGNSSIPIQRAAWIC